MSHARIQIPEGRAVPLWHLRFAYRRVTCGQRVLPTFIIAGAGKGGTTSLYNYLSLHPCVIRGIRKEVHYFDKYFHCGVAWYRAHFPHRLYLQTRRDPSLPLLTGEASPYYMNHPHAAKRCASLLPTARIIFLLRDPLTRAYSHYHHEVRNGGESLGSFEEAIEQEGIRLQGQEERMIDDESYYSFAHQHWSYQRRGRYVEDIERWFSYFSREQVLVMGSERFLAEPGHCLRRVLDFLSLPPWQPPVFLRSHVGHYQPMNPATLHRLSDVFSPYNERLFKLLGQRFEWSHSC